MYMYMYTWLYRTVEYLPSPVSAGSRLSYVAGDHVAIYPVNDEERVARIGELLDTDLDTVVTLTNVDGE